MKEVKLSSVIDLEQIFRVLWQKKKYYLYILPIVFVLSCLIIFPQPRYYDCDVALAPESSSESMMGNLSSIASSIGLNFGEMGASDAIYCIQICCLLQSFW